MSVIQITMENFKEEVLKADVPVLVDFWAPWCGPCATLSPIMEEVARSVENVKICKLNTDEAEEIAIQYRVMSIPTLILFKKGEPIVTSVGVKSKAEILELIK